MGESPEESPGSVPGSFRGAEVLDAGLLSARALRRFYSPVYPGVYGPRGVEFGAAERARAAWLWSRRRGVLAGLSASALLGAKWIEPARPAELIHTNRRPPPAVIVHSDELLAGEVHPIAGMTVTTAARTAFDLGRRSTLIEGVQRIDALMNATGVTGTDVAAIAEQHPGVRGLGQLRRTLALVDGGAESPYESLTRLRLVRAGLPPPQTQIPVVDPHGMVFARIDLGWRDYLVGVEFDGAHHWTDPAQRSWDIERSARLADAGWTIVRVSSGLLHSRGQVVVSRVGAALTAAGCPRTW